MERLANPTAFSSVMDKNLDAMAALLEDDGPKKGGPKKVPVAEEGTGPKLSSINKPKPPKKEKSKQPIVLDTDKTPFAIEIRKVLGQQLPDEKAQEEKKSKGKVKDEAPDYSDLNYWLEKDSKKIKSQRLEQEEEASSMKEKYSEKIKEVSRKLKYLLQECYTKSVTELLRIDNRYRGYIDGKPVAEFDACNEEEIKQHREIHYEEALKIIIKHKNECYDIMLKFMDDFHPLKAQHMDDAIKLITGELAGEQTVQKYLQRSKLDKASKKTLKEQKKDKNLNQGKRQWIQYTEEETRTHKNKIDKAMKEVDIKWAQDRMSLEQKLAKMKGDLEGAHLIHRNDVERIHKLQVNRLEDLVKIGIDGEGALTWGMMARGELYFLKTPQEKEKAEEDNDRNTSSS
eukprot:UC4_evm2s969